MRVPGSVAPACGVVLQEAEITPGNPHHGAQPLGAAAAHAALARMHGANAEAVMARYIAPEDVLELPGHCSACGAVAATRMYQTSIPFFKVNIAFVACNSQWSWSHGG